MEIVKNYLMLLLQLLLIVMQLEQLLFLITCSFKTQDTFVFGYHHLTEYLESMTDCTRQTHPRPINTQPSPKLIDEGIYVISFIPRHNRHIRSKQPVKILLNIHPVSTGSNSKRINQRTCPCTVLRV